VIVKMTVVENDGQTDLGPTLAYRVNKRINYFKKGNPGKWLGDLHVFLEAVGQDIADDVGMLFEPMYKKNILYLVFIHPDVKRKDMRKKYVKWSDSESP